MKKKLVGIMLAASAMLCLMGCGETTETVAIYSQDGEVIEQYENVQNLFVDDGSVTFDCNGKEYGFTNFCVKTVGDVSVDLD